MPAQTHYMTNTLVSGWQSASTTSPGADAYASPVTGWIVGSTAPGSLIYSQFAPGAERLESTFAATIQPDGTLDTTLKDALYIDPGGAGDYASTAWTINGVVRANTNGGAQDGRLRYRLIRADTDGSNATEITSGVVLGATLTNVSNAADFNSSATFTPAAFSVTASQKLFLQIAWERTGAGGMTTADINFRIGNTGTRVVTSNFTPGSTAYTADVNETVNLSESAGAAFDAVAGPSENVGAISESTAAAYGAVAAPAETVAHNESLTTQWATSHGPAETVSISEQLEAGLMLPADVSENVGAIGESTSAAYEARPAPQETVTLAEAVSPTYAANAVPSETVSLAEAALATYAATASASENIGSVGEAISAEQASGQQNFSAGVSETVSLTESVAGSYGATGGVGETVTIAEACDGTLAATAAIGESASLSEQLASIATFAAAVADALSVIEQLDGGLLLTANLTESVSVTDLLALQVAHVASMADGMSVAEVVDVAGSGDNAIALVAAITNPFALSASVSQPISADDTDPLALKGTIT